MNENQMETEKGNSGWIILGVVAALLLVVVLFFHFIPCVPAFIPKDSPSFRLPIVTVSGFIDSWNSLTPSQRLTRMGDSTYMNLMNSMEERGYIKRDH